MQPIRHDEPGPIARAGSALAKSARLARWSLRKLNLPIGPNDLVLDVGSGANPHPRADVLLERYVSGWHRHGETAVADRPTVFADACRMPFKDKAFDYVIAFHVLEHVPTPELFLGELMRVAKAGYIETPNVLFERLVPYDVHCLEIMDLEGRLMIRKKSAPATDTFLAELRVVPRSPMWNAFFYAHPDYFHVRHYWRDRIEFEIVNPDEPCDWYKPSADGDGDGASTSLQRTDARGLALATWRKVTALRRRPIDLPSLLVCPSCRTGLTVEGATFSCKACGRNYANNPWPVFTGS